MNEPQIPQTEKSPVKLHWGRLLIAVLLVAGFFVIRSMLRPPIEYKTLDYDAVMRTPNIFRDEYAVVEGTLWQILPVSPTADTDNIYLQVRERGNEDHIWLVYGPMTADDVLRLEEGMDITARGGFAGVFPITNMIGQEVQRPAVYSLDIEFGCRIGGDQ
jgi:hypothetical protein